MPIDPWLPRAAALRPERIALDAPEGSLTYAELLGRARLDVAPGARVALALAPGLEFAVALHACLLARAAAMPVDPRLAERERSRLLASAAAVVDAPLGPCGPLAPPRAPADGDTALVVHTSGTTGAPKPVELSFGNVQANALGSAVALALDPDERWLCPMPLSHVGGLMVLLRSAIYATTAVLAPPPFDLDRTAALLRDGEITIASLVPTMLARLLDAGHRPGPRLRAVLLGGAAATPALLERARDAGWPVAATYGLTQACSQVTVARPGDLHTAGHPLPGVRVAIADDGEILVEGPTVAGGGTLHTGDLGRLDEHGRLLVAGRKADTIVTGGENVAPAEVEAVLMEHPAVADAGVFARPHPEWGEAVTASVVLRAPVEPEELRAFCRERLAGYKVPKVVEPVATLPRTPSGKLLRRELA
ncbi:MAG: o-succinylbenzoate---CoA ligase [Solirubrobacteraceae bacterium]|nr:o-succinylbenzoate---CoA ligase [Solirubrobacteraceae bacterium]